MLSAGTRSTHVYYSMSVQEEQRTLLRRICERSATLWRRVEREPGGYKADALLFI